MDWQRHATVVGTADFSGCSGAQRSFMQDDLDKERKVIMKQWAKRQAQIESVMNSTVGMYGDLQGIAGKSLQEIEGLGLPALEMKP